VSTETITGSPSPAPGPTTGSPTSVTSQTDAYSALAAKAVDLTDAIAILKMIVGLDVNSGGSPITAYQAYAADVDGNGKVELSDAISVLKRIVGLETMKADWMFFNKANGAPVISDKLNPGVPPSPSAFVNNPTSPNVNIFAVLRGDIIANSQYTYYWTLTSSPANSTAPTIGTSTSPAFYATTTGKYEAVVTIMDESFNSSQTTTSMLVCNSASNTSNPFSSCAGNSTSVVDGWPIYPALSVKATSYENKNLADLTQTQIPIDAVTGKTLVPTSVTFGDFFQEGQYSAFVVSTDGQAYFLRWKTTTSSWVDDSARLFGSGARYTCNATYAITADFNGDGKPDVFLSCSGLSNQLMFVSSGSTYVRRDTLISVDGNRAAAADIDGDGILDLVLTQRNAVPQVWKGNTGGVTFTQQIAWLVNTTCNGFTLPTNIDSVFLVAGSSGRVDLLVGGVSTVGGQPYVQMRKQTTLPFFTTCNSKGFQQIYDASNNNAYLRDLIFKSNKYYLLTQSNLSNQIQFSSYSVNPDGTMLFSRTISLYESSKGEGLPQQYKYYSSGDFRPYEAGCTRSRCSSEVNIPVFDSDPASSLNFNFLIPSRIVAFGDALVDVGQVGRVDPNNANTKYRFTINQVETATAFNIGTTFIEMLANYFGFGTVTYALDSIASGRLPSAGAYSYGEFGALVSGAANFGAGASEPTDDTLQVADARGCQKVSANKSTRASGAASDIYCAYNLQAQIDLFLAQGTPTSDDLFVISIGTGDIMATGIRAMNLTTNSPYLGLSDIQISLGGPLTSTAVINLALENAANALAKQAKRLTDAGAKYVLIVGPPNVGRSPWAAETGNATLLQNLSVYNSGSGFISMNSAFWSRLQTTFGNAANNPIMYLGTSGLVEAMTDSSSTTFTNKTSPACVTNSGTSTTVISKSIGTGIKPATALGAMAAGRLSAALCTTATIGGADSATYVYADGVNFTPSMQLQIYNQVLPRMRVAAWIQSK
jgi:hypothetical protein